MIDPRATPRQLALIGFALALLLAGMSYRPALNGQFMLDDRSNLEGLGNVEDIATAVDFVLGGDAGPTGRPLALASFALQAGQWEQGPAAFLTVNILLHLLNAVMLALCFYAIGRARGADADRAVAIAAAAASLWVLLPLLASASLLVVQRMTTLSATFMLLGLLAYLRARSHIDTRPVAALTAMSVSLLGGTALATLSKESGLLLPVFVLVLEATVLERPRRPELRIWRLWQAAFLWLPLALLLYYLATLTSYSESLALRRGYEPLERLLTETRILWIYLQKALLGLPGSLGIYQTPPPLSRSIFEPVAALAALSWLGLLVVALVWRRRAPLFALAVLWYLGGHLLESTLVALELYFEHRNYLPIAGPLFALVSIVAARAKGVRRAGLAALVVVLFLNSFFLYTFASIWGEPSRSSRYWASLYPDSPRAVATMARFQLEEEGALRALQTIDRFVIDHPEQAYLRIQELNLRCRVIPDANHTLVLEQLHGQLPGAVFTFTAGTMLSELLDTVVAGDCNGVDSATVAALAESLRANPRYARDRMYGEFHHRLLAAIARLQGDDGATLENLQRAIALNWTSELNMMMVTALASRDDFDGALEFIDDARRARPRNPVRALRWQRDLDGLRDYILELRSANDDRPARAAESSE